MNVTPQMLTVEQVAQLLGVSTRTVTRKIHDGDIRAVNVGRKRAARPSWRIPATEAEQLMGDYHQPEPVAHHLRPTGIPQRRAPRGPNRFPVTKAN